MKKLFLYGIFLTILLGSVNLSLAQDYVLLRDTVQKEVVSFTDVRVDNQQDVKLFFEINSSTINPDFSSNQSSLDILQNVLTDKNASIGLDSLVLCAVSSIDGNEAKNKELSKARAQAVVDYIVAEFPQFDSDIIKVNVRAEAWQELRDMVQSDMNVPSQAGVLQIIDNDKISADAKEAKLKSYDSGKSWRYIRDNILPSQRFGASVVFFYNINREKLISYEDEITIDTMIVEKAPDVVSEPEPRIIALKTNLLYDLLATPNIEIEVPIGDKWSISAEYNFANWSNTKNYYTQNIQFGHLALTYWLGDRANFDKLTGWNVSAQLGFGSYDIQLFRDQGKQATGVYNIGVALGYAHAINKKGNLHLHYQIGAGYRGGKQYEYYLIDDYILGNDLPTIKEPWTATPRAAFGLTQAEVSLVWILDLGTK